MLQASVACRGVLAPRQSALLAKAQRGPRGSLRRALAVNNKYVLVPIGDGSCDHLEESIPLPNAIELTGEGLFEVGRDVPADVILKVPTVSTRHAMIRIVGDKMQLTDLNSTNGTWLGDQQLAPMKNTEVPVGSEITFGDMYLAKFKVEEVPDVEVPNPVPA
eukprot:jgi/Botrbrau1/5333/Bobra.0346s0007.1